MNDTMMVNNNLKTMAFTGIISVMIMSFLMTDMAFAFTDLYVNEWEIKDKQLITIQDQIAEKQIMLYPGMNNIPLSDEQRNLLTNSITELQIQEQIIIGEVDALELFSIESFTVDPETEQRLLSGQQLIIDKYLNTPSAQYVGENMVNFVMVDYQDQRLHMLIDIPTTPTSSYDVIGSRSIQVPIPNFTDETGVPVNVEFGEVTDVSCRSRISNCSPLVAGISIAKTGQGLNDDSSIGFKATNTSGITGFVIAGHAANVNDYIYQKAGGTKVGQVITEVISCDCAFVNVTTTMTDSIYKNSRQHYAIRDYAIDSDFVRGTFLKKSGVATGITYGDLRSTTTSAFHKVLVGTNVSSGDSGSPVFRSYGYNNAELFGIIVSDAGSYGAAMEKYSHIKTSLSLR